MNVADQAAIIIVGLGPGDGRLLTREAWDVLTSAEVIYLRTARHPAIADFPPHLRLVSFDHVYDSADDFDQVYDQIAAEVLRLGQQAAAQQTRPVVYAVPGHPFVGESTVARIVLAAQKEGLPVRVMSGLSFIEPTLTALGLDGLDGLQLFDAIEIAGYNHPPVNSDVPLLLGQVYSRLLASELKIALMAIYPDDHEVMLVHAAGTGEQSTEQASLYAIDRSDRVGHLTSLYVPPLPCGSTLSTLAETVATLRSPEGCPWDREQTPQSLRSGFLEEASELLAAIDAADPVGLQEELGDVLFHLVMQAQMAAEADEFRLSDVLAAIDAKLKRRHPHVWGDWQVADSAEVVHNWEMLKAQEKASDETAASLLDNIPHALPALARAQKIQDRVRRVGFDWPDVQGVLAKVEEEVSELKAATSPAEQLAELGDVLFALVNWARWLGLDAETALRETNLRFGRRFRHLEQLAASRGLVLTQLELPALDALWEEAKSSLAAADEVSTAGTKEVK